MKNEKIKNAVKVRYSQLTEMRNDLNAWAGCIAGALEQRQYLRIIKEAGFADLQVLSSREFYVQDSNDKKMAKLSSITIRAYNHE